MSAASHPAARECAAPPQATSSASVAAPATTLTARAAATLGPPVR